MAALKPQQISSLVIFRMNSDRCCSLVPWSRFGNFGGRGDFFWSFDIVWLITKDDFIHHNWGKVLVMSRCLISTRMPRGFAFSMDAWQWMHGCIRGVVISACFLERVFAKVAFLL